jgi:uncharacterized protein
MTFEPRTYRRRIQPEGLVAFEVALRETDLQILAETDLTDEALMLMVEARAQIEGFAAAMPWFAESFVPVPVHRSAPLLVKRMAEAAFAAGVGPMASVAGAIAEFVAIGLTSHSREVVVENGGDDFLVLARERIVAIHAGDSPLSDQVGLRVGPLDTPLAVATSSATVGPSVSLGIADAVTVLAHSGALADAVASAAGNRVHHAEDIQAAIEVAASVPGIVGAVIVVGGAMGAWGGIDLVPLG